ncbi:MAG: patatin-like phospholipase family protein [Silvanigrellaceae bacterium]|nr:patatin-like phospholipase family protein [Silvanigrellaceae bacterium]
MKAHLQGIVASGSKQSNNAVKSYSPALLVPRAPKPIKRASRSGGGAKGANYPGSFEAEVEAGLHEEIDFESGASAGAITSAFIACGITPKAFRDVFLKENFKNHLGDRVKDKEDKKKPGVSVLTKDGAPLLKLLRDTISDSIKTILDARAAEIVGNKDIENIQKKIKRGQPITFSDLAILHEKWPKDFKHLSVIAVEYPSGKPQIFNYRTTPNVEIALACRASASLPVFLAPVEIDFGNGDKRTFVDGGLYDNLPVDCFDMDQEGNFQKNTMPEQTLIYAFGEGTDDTKNQVFQAQFGSKMDEMLSDDILSDILEGAIKRYQDIKKIYGTQDPEQLLQESLNYALDKFVLSATSLEEKRQFQNIAKVIGDTANEYLHDLIRNPVKYPETYVKLKQATSTEKAAVLTEFLREKITPVLYKASPIEQLKRDKLTSVIGGMKTDYKNTEQKEKGYQKIRNDYALRTVELRVGNIKTTDFNLATKYARVMNTLGYLDTINHFINHDLYDSNRFDPKPFYIEIVKNFEQIHLALLDGSGRSHEDSALFVDIRDLKNKLKGKDEETINREVLYLIKQFVEKNPGSPEAFALSRAHEFRSKHIDANQLFKEVYEESFRRGSKFSQSKISGQTIYSSTSLHKALDKQDMFQLYQQDQENTRSGKIFSALIKLEPFKTEAKISEQAIKPEYISNRSSLKF